MDLLQLLKNISGAYPDAVRLLNAIAYAGGAFLVFRSMLNLARQHGGGTKASINDNAWLWQMSVAVFLFALPSFIDSTATQIFGSTPQNPMGYAKSSLDSTGPLLAPLAGLLQILGMVFAIRGLWVLQDFGVNATRNGSSFGKGAVQIVAGVLLVNLDPFLRTIELITGLRVGAGLIY